MQPEKLDPYNHDPRREKQRRRTVLRSGKIATINGKFIADCQIYDRSEKGVRLRLSLNVELPEHVRVFDDEQNILFAGKVVWRNAKEIGVEFAEGEQNIERHGKRHAMLSGKYYAVSTNE